MEKFGLRLMAMKTASCWSFIVLNIFFANVCEKNCASPTSSLTARHCRACRIKLNGHMEFHIFKAINFRGEVEDTTFEAKDSKKIRGQG